MSSILSSSAHLPLTGVLNSFASLPECFTEPGPKPGPDNEPLLLFTDFVIDKVKLDLEDRLRCSLCAEASGVLTAGRAGGVSRAIRNAEGGAGVRRVFCTGLRVVGGARAGVLCGFCIEVEDVKVELVRAWDFGWTMGWREEKDVEGASLGLANRRLGAVGGQYLLGYACMHMYAIVAMWCRAPRSCPWYNMTAMNTSLAARSN